MTLPRHLLPSWIKIKRIWIALDCRCEICGDEVQFNHLVLHHIPEGEGESEDKLSLEGSMLALCSACHRELHAQCIDREEQLKLVISRLEELRERIRRILCHESKPYSPPDLDMEQLYEEAKQVGQLIFGV